MHANKAASGFTLIEIVIVIVFISIAMVGVLSAYTNAMRNSAAPMHQIRAIKLAQAYMEEILNKRFDEASGQGGLPRCGSSDTGSLACTSVGSFGADSGETRSLYDDVDDFHGINEQPPIDSLGNVRTDYDNYRTEISVSYAGNELSSLNNVDAKRINIIITTASGTSFNFSAYRVNF
ncbi:MAG: prepilin-type N-terminal cleavage/methylation domain-containing protein [Thiohalomonadales bacterium]